MGDGKGSEVTANGPQRSILAVDAPIGEPDTLVRVSKKRGKIEVEDTLPQSLVISRADLPPMMAITDSLEKRREDRVAKKRAEKIAQQRLFDAY